MAWAGVACSDESYDHAAGAGGLTGAQHRAVQRALISRLDGNC